MFGFPLVFLFFLFFAMVSLVCGGAPLFDIVFLCFMCCFVFLSALVKILLLFFVLPRGRLGLICFFVPEYSYGCSDCPNLST